jgi:hypothetical protein
VGHELDAEDVSMVPCGNTSVEGEWFGEIDRVIIPDIEVGIIGSGSELIATP